MEYYLMILLLVLSMISSAFCITTFNVLNYGAVGNGRADESQAFMNAWKAACQAPPSVVPMVVVPAGRTFMLKPITFAGPCKSSRIFMQVSGRIVGPNSKSAWSGFHINSWITFSNVNGLFITGRGTIDGQGPAWWPNACLHTPPNGVKCDGPTALTFNRCHGLRLNGLSHINSPRSHITLTACRGVIISNLRIFAPGDSPNTDGIDISGCSNVQIRNCIIGTGDDCVAIAGGSSNINIVGVTCGPGHGISIGALGHGGFDAVEDIHVRNCTFRETTNGVRIKSWQGGNGYARRISFDKIRFISAGNPVIIDQFYCPSRINCQNFTSAIKISDVSFTGITGTSSTDQVINLSCSQSVGCSNLVLDHVYISTNVPGKKAYATCFNAHGRATHTKPNPKCLLP